MVLLAASIVEKCKYIHPSRTEEIEQVSQLLMTLWAALFGFLFYICVPYKYYVLEYNDLVLQLLLTRRHFMRYFICTNSVFCRSHFSFCAVQNCGRCLSLFDAGLHYCSQCCPSQLHISLPSANIITCCSSLITALRDEEVFRRVDHSTLLLLFFHLIPICMTLRRLLICDLAKAATLLS